MKVKIKYYDGKEIFFLRAFSVTTCGPCDEEVKIEYPDDYDHGVLEEVSYNTDNIARIEITFREV